MFKEHVHGFFKGIKMHEGFKVLRGVKKNGGFRKLEKGKHPLNPPWTSICEKEALPVISVQVSFWQRQVHLSSTEHPQASH